MKKITFLFLLSSLILFSCQKENGLSEEEVVAALKSALTVGTDTSVSRLNKEDGYFMDAAVKILLPPEADVIFTNLSSIPGGQLLVDNTVKSINRAAEDAAVEAKPIFVNAITGMTITDAFNILDGNDSAATSFLRGKTYESLRFTFQPKIQTSLEKPLILGTSTEVLYSNLISTYNSASLGGILFPMITENTLSEYTTRRALNGLFTKVADEEKKIRTDPLHRVTEILQKVFGN